MRGILAAVLTACAIGSAWAERVQQLAATKPAPGNERRVALVIGNSAYKSAPLRNPANDARAMARALAEAGFSVTLAEDVGRAGMNRAIREFGDTLARGGVGLFYFAGHGMQVRNRNYLVPVDVEIEREDEVEFQAVDANLVLSKMDSARNAANIVILDACRNNPFKRSFTLGATGLAQMDAPSGTLIAFATAPGQVAADGEGENGLYTKHLLQTLKQPGLPVEQLFKQVRIGVTTETKDKQVPWESSSLKGDFFFLVLPPGMQAEEQKRQQQQVIDKAVTEAVKQSEDRGAKERAELEGKMKQLIEQMLAKQRADLVAEMKARGSDAAAPAVAAPAAQPPKPAPVAEAPKPLPVAPPTAAAPKATPAPAPAAQAPKPAPVAAVPRPAPAPPVRVASVVPAPSASPQARTALPKIGDSWNYVSTRHDDQKSRMQVTVKGVTESGILDSLVRGGKPFDRVHQPVPIFFGQGGYWQFAPYAGAFGMLKDGAEWRDFHYQNVGVCSRIPTCDIRAKVVGKERVTVAAGTFDAWKVVVDYYGPRLTREFTYWYAEEAKRYVKYTIRGNRGNDYEYDIELVSYKLN